MKYIPYILCALSIILLGLMIWCGFQVVSVTHLTLQCHGQISFNEEQEKIAISNQLNDGILIPYPSDQAALATVKSKKAKQ